MSPNLRLRLKERRLALDGGPIPGLAAWEANMISATAQGHATYFAVGGQTDDYYTAGYYYDYGIHLHQTAAYTGNSWWTTYANLACSTFIDHYLDPSYNASGYRNYTQGLRADWERSGIAASKTAAILMSTNSAYAGDATPLASTESAWLSREVANAINSYIDAEALGETHRTRMDDLLEQALDHIDQLIVTRTLRVAEGDANIPYLAGMFYCQPFMLALTCRALIRYFEQIDADSRILPAVTAVADFLWAEAWMDTEGAFWYDNCKDGADAWGPWLPDTAKYAGDTELTGNPAVDLNMLIVPLFGWVWSRTGTQAYLDNGDEIFSRSVDPGTAAHYYQKQFNQNYLWSFDYVRWRTS